MSRLRLRPRSNEKGQGHLKVKATHNQGQMKGNQSSVYCTFFCDICVTEMVRFPLKGILVLVNSYQVTLADPGGARDVPPPPVPIFFIFMQFLEKIGQNNRLAPPPLQLAHHSLGNPGSATR